MALVALGREVLAPTADEAVVVAAAEEAEDWNVFYRNLSFDKFPCHSTCCNPGH